MKEEVRLPCEGGEGSRYPRIVGKSLELPHITTGELATHNLWVGRSKFPDGVGVKIDSGGHGGEVVEEDGKGRGCRDVVEELMDGGFLHCAGYRSHQFWTW